MILRFDDLLKFRLNLPIFRLATLLWVQSVIYKGQTKNSNRKLWNAWKPRTISNTNEHLNSNNIDWLWLDWRQSCGQYQTYDWSQIWQLVWAQVWLFSCINVGPNCISPMQECTAWGTWKEKVTNIMEFVHMCTFM